MADIERLKGEAVQSALALKCYGNAMANENYLTIANVLDRVAAELTRQQQRAERVRAAATYLGPMGQGVLAALDGNTEVRS